jgi:hypothetical protein
MEKPKSRKLEKWEEEYYGRLISETNPYRLQPHHQGIFLGIRDEFNLCISREQDVWLTEKQISAIRRSHNTSQRTEAKLRQPRHYDAEARLNVWTNPMKPRS